MTAPIDHHLESLGTYLKTRLNEAGAALSAPLVVVEDVTYLTDFNSLDKFPLLQVFRNGGNGWGASDRQEWEINYVLNNFADPYDVPRILAWILEDYNENNIPALLINYFSSTDNCGTLDIDSLTRSYGYKFLAGAKAPSAQVTFTLLP
jgi:hypothetical protein